MKNHNEMTKDSMFGGNLICYQNKTGYRYSIDSILLAHFCLEWKNAFILDMGCGCGILSLLMLYRNQENINQVVGAEVQERLAGLAEINCIKNDFSEKFSLLHADYREISNYYPAESFSHVICNPPFYTLGRGRICRNNENFVAKHQITASLEDIVAIMSFSLKNKGIAAMIYPAVALPELIGCLLMKKLQPKRIRLVYSYPESEKANLVLVESKKNGGGGCGILPSLFIYEKRNGNLTREVQDMYLP